MSKIRLPKCPYCKTEYKERFGDIELTKLVIDGSVSEEIVKCHNCDKKFRVHIKLMYYGSKL